MGGLDGFFWGRAVLVPRPIKDTVFLVEQ